MPATFDIESADHIEDAQSNLGSRQFAKSITYVGAGEGDTPHGLVHHNGVHKGTQGAKKNRKNSDAVYKNTRSKAKAHNATQHEHAEHNGGKKGKKGKKGEKDGDQTVKSGYKHLLVTMVVKMLLSTANPKTGKQYTKDEIVSLIRHNKAKVNGSEGWVENEVRKECDDPLEPGEPEAWRKVNPDAEVLVGDHLVPTLFDTAQQMFLAHAVWLKQQDKSIVVLKDAKETVTAVRLAQHKLIKDFVEWSIHYGQTKETGVSVAFPKPSHAASIMGEARDNTVSGYLIDFLTVNASAVDTSVPRVLPGVLKQETTFALIANKTYKRPTSQKEEVSRWAISRCVNEKIIDKLFTILDKHSLNEYRGDLIQVCETIFGTSLNLKAALKRKCVSAVTNPDVDPVEYPDFDGITMDTNFVVDPNNAGVVHNNNMLKWKARMLSTLAYHNMRVTKHLSFTKGQSMDTYVQTCTNEITKKTSPVGAAILKEIENAGHESSYDETSGSYQSQEKIYHETKLIEAYNKTDESEQTAKSAIFKYWTKVIAEYESHIVEIANGVLTMIGYPLADKKILLSNLVLSKYAIYNDQNGEWARIGITDNFIESLDRIISCSAMNVEASKAAFRAAVTERNNKGMMVAGTQSTAISIIAAAIKDRWDLKKLTEELKKLGGITIKEIVQLESTHNAPKLNGKLASRIMTKLRRFLVNQTFGQLRHVQENYKITSRNVKAPGDQFNLAIIMEPEIIKYLQGMGDLKDLEYMPMILAELGKTKTWKGALEQRYKDPKLAAQKGEELRVEAAFANTWGVVQWPITKDASTYNTGVTTEIERLFGISANAWTEWRAFWLKKSDDKIQASLEAEKEAYETKKKLDEVTRDTVTASGRLIAMTFVDSKLTSTRRVGAEDESEDVSAVSLDAIGATRSEEVSHYLEAASAYHRMVMDDYDRAEKIYEQALVAFNREEVINSFATEVQTMIKGKADAEVGYNLIIPAKLAYYNNASNDAAEEIKRLCAEYQRIAKDTNAAADKVYFGITEAFDRLNAVAVSMEISEEDKKARTEAKEQVARTVTEEKRKKGAPLPRARGETLKRNGKPTDDDRSAKATPQDTSGTEDPRALPGFVPAI